MQSEALSRLIAAFRRAPAVGQKSATCHAYAILDMADAEAEEFANAVLTAKAVIHFCKECGNYTDTEVCEHCRTADKSVICVVKEPRDILARENGRLQRALPCAGRLFRPSKGHNSRKPSH